MTKKPKAILGVGVLLSVSLFVVDGMAVPGEKVLVSDVISSHIAVQGHYLIWSEYSDTPIRKIPKYGKDGGTISTLAHAMGGPMNLVIHDGYIFWIDRRGSGQPSDLRILNKTSLDGTTTTALAQGYQYINGGREYADIAIYEDSVYWVTGGYGVFSINKVPINGGESTTLVSRSRPITSLARDGSSLYWVEWADDGYDKGAIMNMSLEGGPPSILYSNQNTLVWDVMAVSGGEIVFRAIDSVQGHWGLMKVSATGGDPTFLAILTDQPNEPTNVPSRIIINGSNVYWADSLSVNTIPLAGGEPVVIVHNIYPQDLATIGGYLYWTERQFYERPGSIKRIPTTGGAVTVLTDKLDLPLRLATDGPYLYFAENFPNSSHPYIDGRLAKMSQDGGAIQTLVSGVANITPDWGGVYQTVPIAVDSTNVYFVDRGAVKKVPLAGGPVERIASFPLYPIDSVATDGEFAYCLDDMTTVWKIPVNGGEPIALTPWSPDFSSEPIRVVGDMIYWASDDYTIKKMDKNGGGVVTIASNLPSLSDFVVDGENIFFSENDTGRIRRISVNGGPITTLAYSRGMYWNIMAVDQESVYWITYDAIGKVPKTGGNVTLYGGLNTYLDYPSGIAVDQNGLYWTETGAGTIKKMDFGQTVFRVDFDGDGKTDILWRHMASGQNAVWLMNGVSWSSSAWLPPVTDTNSEIVGAGDFNGDGIPDILWRHKTTGQNAVWLMNGTTWNSTVSLPAVTDTDWEIVGAGDFNGDEKTDILWRHKTSGQNAVWLMDGTTWSSSVPLPTVSDTNWEIVGIGDFNKDGKNDILWRHRTTGQNAVWLMNGTTWSSSVWFPGVSDTNWQIVGTGDFNGDGKTDILWRHKTSGENAVWLMDGTTWSSTAWLPAVTDTNWQIVGP